MTMRSRHSIISIQGLLWLWGFLLAVKGGGTANVAASTTSSSSSSSSSSRTSTSRRAFVSDNENAADNDDDEYNILSAPPISFTQAITSGGGSQSLNKFISHRWEKAIALAKLEQDVEDYNAAYIASATNPIQAISHRRLIAMPLLDDDTFNPPMGIFSHNHVQTGDKMSLPKNFWQSITLSKAQVPWLFSVSRINNNGRVELESTKQEGKSSSSSKDNKKDEKDHDNDNDKDDDKEKEDKELLEYKPYRPLDSVVGGALDFRAPSNYIFLPLWMMRALGLRPRDVVVVELIQTVPAGASAKLRPRRAEFAKRISNPRSVLETELRHYSSLTQGSTIAMDYNNQRYWLDVVEVRSSPRGDLQNWIKVQDCDIATDFLPSKEDVLLAQKAKLKRQQEKRKQQQQQ